MVDPSSGTPPEGNTNPVEEVFRGFEGARLEGDGVADVPDRPRKKRLATSGHGKQ